MINLCAEVIDAVENKRIPKDDLLVALLRIVGNADLRTILESHDWIYALERGDELPEYKEKAFSVDDLQWNNDMEDNEDD